ncbi:MAG: IS66 family insertion sequence element accessory protein TnpB [Roseburia sp.]|nr:IS66 family insertion sequence element accessory protein TnpB [Anaeroplasma bactoclasticum]MCM1196840.1 IS66 family insertion sequence element accessory protein TnpB [Roseburia sp.]MCM1557038.1 IS66 family insertion sequence element accessory protein TnpB [Anaeroplasma bactoclasticum]
MVDLRNVRGIYLYPDIVSFRKGIPALTNLILTSYKESEILDCIFVFFGKNKRQVKMLEINDDGIWLYEKKLKEASFILPNVDGNVKIDKRQLIEILKIIKPKKIRNVT